MLVLFHGSEQIVAIRPDVPAETVAFELCRLWIDHVFSPSMRYLDGVKGDHDEQAAERFIVAFTEEEYEWVERFHRFLELRIDRLSDEQKTACTFPINDTWRGITQDAGNLLDLLDPTGSRKTKQVAEAMRSLVPDRSANE